MLLPRRHHCRLVLFVSPVVSGMFLPATPVIDSSTIFVVAQSIFLWFISCWCLFLWLFPEALQLSVLLVGLMLPLPLSLWELVHRVFVSPVVSGMFSASRHFVGYRRVATALLLFVSPVVSGIITVATPHANATKGPICIGLQRLPHAELGRWHLARNRFSSCHYRGIDLFHRLSPVHQPLVHGPRDLRRSPTSCWGGRSICAPTLVVGDGSLCICFGSHASHPLLRSNGSAIRIVLFPWLSVDCIVDLLLLFVLPVHSGPVVFFVLPAWLHTPLLVGRS
jgi:hypothetical protein